MVSELDCIMQIRIFGFSLLALRKNIEFSKEERVTIGENCLNSWTIPVIILFLVSVNRLLNVFDNIQIIREWYLFLYLLLNVKANDALIHEIDYPWFQNKRRTQSRPRYNWFSTFSEVPLRFFWLSKIQMKFLVFVYHTHYPVIWR